VQVAIKAEQSEAPRHPRGALPVLASSHARSRLSSWLHSGALK